MISLLVALGILAAVGYGAYQGTRRGLIIIAFEFVSFALATLTAIVIYHPLGTVVKTIAGVNIALGNVAAFVTVWTVSEVLCALFVHFVVLRRLPPQVHFSNLNRAGGGLFGAFKTAAIITLALIVFDGLPIAASIKKPVITAPVAAQFIAASGDLQPRLAAGLGRDINDSFDFFTITASPESEVHIDLGFTTTNFTVDSHLEADMLGLINHERTLQGLPSLTLNLKARAVARAYSAEMFTHGYFSHIDAAGKSPFDRMKTGGVSFTSAGENLALAPTLSLAHDGLMKSPEHRANILSSAYRTVGIGVVDGGPYGLMITQDFTD
ncbi:MAG TPA: CvpA family protein [Candidatus Saccharimonadia bacterium]|nr:CvpA family protein [Candidatus Saccharimonadia bacterium]